MKTIRLLSFAVLYFFGAYFALRYGGADGTVAVLWPASGVAFAAILIDGAVAVPLLLVADILASWSDAGTVSGADVLYAVGNVGSALAAAWVLRRVLPRRQRIYDCAENMVAFVFIGAGGSALLASLIGVSVLHSTGGGLPQRELVHAWWVWFLSDLIGVVVVSPMLIAWYYRRLARFRGIYQVETYLLLSGLFLINWLVFGRSLTPAFNEYPFAFAFMPFMAWAAFRLGVRTLSTIIFLSSVLSVVGTLRGLGPFAESTASASVLPLQAFIGIMASTSLVLHSVIRERTRAEESLQESQVALVRANTELEERVAERTRNLSEALENLAKAEEAARSFYENAIQGMFKGDAKGRLLSANPAMAQMLGYESAEALLEAHDSPGDFFYNPADFEPWRDKVRAREELRNIETVLRHRNGEPVWVLGNVWLAEDSTGEEHIEGILFDNTQRKIAEEDLRRSERLYRRIIETASEGFYRTDGNLRITDVNRTLCRMLGYSEEELVGLHPREITSEEFREFWDKHEQSVRSQEQTTWETELRKKDGETIPFLVSDSSLRDENDQPVGRIAFLSDITQMKEAEQLRDDVERITRHDLKNPLTSVVALPKVLRQEGDLTERQARCVDMIESAGYRMLGLINLSLDLYKMETGTYELHRTPIDLLPLLDRTRQDLAQTMRAQDVDLEICVRGRRVSDEDVFVASGDELLCYSMISNLVKNAVEASPHGANIRVSLDEDATTSHVHITNEGVIPPEIRERFFDKYATSGKRSGTGLGTYSAHLIAQTHDGRVDFETSDEKNQTTVSIHLPR